MVGGSGPARSHRNLSERGSGSAWPVSRPGCAAVAERSTSYPAGQGASPRLLGPSSISPWQVVSTADGSPAASPDRSAPCMLPAVNRSPLSQQRPPSLNLQMGSPGHGAMERVTRFVRLLHSALRPSIRSPHCQYWTRVSRTVKWPSGKGPVVVQSIPMRSVGCGPNEPLSYVQVSFPSISNAIAHW